MTYHQTESEFQREFKDRLKRWRKAMRKPNGKAWSQADMAEALGVMTNTYAKWEQQSSSDRNFPLYLLPRLCEITGHDPWTALTEQAKSSSPGRRKAR